MKFRSLSLMLLVVFTVSPVLVAGIVSYFETEDIISQYIKNDLNDKLDYCLTLCDYYGEKVDEGRMSREEAINELAVTLVGPKFPGSNNRDLSKGLRIGNVGYISARYPDLTYVMHPSDEGQKPTDPTLVKVNKILVQSIKKGRVDYAYEWIDPQTGAVSTRWTIGDYSKSLGIIISINVSVDELMGPVGEIRNITIAIALLSGFVAILVALFASTLFSKPIEKLSKGCKKIMQGNLSARVEGGSSILEFNEVSDTVNQMVNSLEEKIRDIEQSKKELATAIELVDSTLKKIISTNDLSLRIKLEKLSENYKSIGENINRLVSNLQRSIQDLENNRTFLRQIITDLPDVLVVTDNDGKWVEVSPSFEKLTGYKIEEVMGKKTTEQPVYRDLSEGIEINRKMWERVYKGEVVTGLELPWRTRNGEKLILSVAEKMLSNAEGKAIGRVFLAKDITEVKKKEEELKNSLIREQTIIDNALDLIILLDREFHWVLVNRAWEEVTGYSPEELEGGRTEEQPCVTDETMVAARKSRKKLKKGEIVPPYDIIFKAKDGRKVIVSATESPLITASGETIGSVFTGRDVTELRKKERELEKTTIDKRYFESYSNKALELADSWGMGEVFKREMDEWAKKHKTEIGTKK
jgi:PAS domain S-box-containing protein